ncbi:hypothetical protein PAHAL_2G331100 [Panicum hallii]|uniref:Uncharacterized protein n=1 Tax=Panicum hallii TaxID=206008 RepID=A0A2S3H191_9POAL|nr:hypothetical protein PAHAL_2G331100 [Panicum hallii]
MGGEHVFLMSCSFISMIMLCSNLYNESLQMKQTKIFGTYVQYSPQTLECSTRRVVCRVQKNPKHFFLSQCPGPRELDPVGSLATSMVTASVAFTAGAKQAPWQGATLAAWTATTTMASTRATTKRSGQLLGEAIGYPGQGTARR